LDADLCALLLGEDGQIAGDSDVVFCDAPRDASGAVALTDDPSSTGIRIDPGSVPTGVAGSWLQ
jgi:stress response protein SCP2